MSWCEGRERVYLRKEKIGTERERERKEERKILLFF